jgi:hypothetical protein
MPHAARTASPDPAACGGTVRVSPQVSPAYPPLWRGSSLPTPPRTGRFGNREAFLRGWVRAMGRYLVLGHRVFA